MTNVNEWTDWKWQQRNSLSSASDVKKHFPNFPEDELAQIAEYDKIRRWGITPYTLFLMGKDSLGNPDPSDPLVKQFFPVRGFNPDDSYQSYTGTEINWELKDEMPTPILQHKYTNKALVRIVNDCLGYCGFCFEVSRVEDKTKLKHKSEAKNNWQISLDYISNHPEIREIIISGGDPLLISDNVLEQRLEDIVNIPSIRAIRLNTKALTHNPFRFTRTLLEKVLSKVNGLGLHFAHPNELAWRDEQQSVLDNYSGIKYAMIPLLKGINDNKDILEELFMQLYEKGIKPYALYHAFPFTQSASQYRTSVKKGVELMLSLKRHISNIAMPEYTIVHHKGKQTVPLEIDGTHEFQYTQDEIGNPIIKFRNWKGNWEIYLDSKEE